MRSFSWGLRFKIMLSILFQARRILLPVMALSVVVIAGRSLSSVPASSMTQIDDGWLHVHFIDVGQGDGIFIQSPAGTTVLIDGGYDNGLALAYLQQQGIERVDTVIASHPHADHIGGLTEVMHALPVGGVWTSGASHTTSYFERFLDAIIEKQIPYHEVTSGGEISVGDLHFEVLHGEARAGDLNNTSLVLRLDYHQVSFLFTGDAEQPVEQTLVRAMPQRLPVTVLKVGHHGSYTSSSPAFIAAVQPQIAIYSAGRNNSYGHPHRGTLNTLTSAGTAIYGTDQHGTIRVSTDGQEIEIVTESEAVSAQALPTVAPVPGELVSGYDPFGRDRNCSAFDTHAEAQAFFQAAGGPERDPHRLDGDNDGIACESLP